MSPLGFFKKQRLAAKGLSCGKTRRSAGERELVVELEGSPWIRAAIILAAAGLLTWLSFEGNPAEPLKNLLYALLILAVVVVHPLIARGGALAENSKLALFLAVIFIQLGAGALLLGVTESDASGRGLMPLAVPYALAPLTISVLLGSQNGFWAALAASLWWTILRGPSDGTPLLLALTGGMTAVIATQRVRRRSKLLRAGFYSGASVFLLAILVGKTGPISWDVTALEDWRGLLLGCGIPLGTGLLTGVLVSGALPLLEQLFRITTDISWLEMSDLNHPLLKRLSLEAPGTYHHSLAVANLSEAAAEVVGANPTICRVASYFHDIGKVVKPHYFTENIPHGSNPHDDLTPTMSALIIISHVKEGVDLALKNKLNAEIIDVISQHHGTSLVSYFYQRALQQQEDARLGGKIMNMREEDIPEVSEESFRYPGPRPQTKEAAIVSLADSIESASRSLDRPTPQRIDDLIRNIIKARLGEGQLDEAPLTIAEIWKIADSFRFSLVNMLHARIAYPKREERSAPEKREQKSAA